MSQSLRQQLEAFFKHRNFEPCHLSDGVRDVRFYCNPTEFEQTSEFIQVTVQTRTGFGRFEYGAAPNGWSMTGFTGNAGLEGPGGLYDLEQFRPQAGRPNKLLLFRYPNRFRGIRYVKMNKMSDNMSADMHLYNQYKMEFVEMGPTQTPPALRLSGGNPMNVTLPVGG
jgi:hypothetical protein